MHPVLAYVILLAMRPLPYIAGGLIVGWVFVAFELYDNDYVALAIPTGMAVGFSLVFLPLTLALHRAAKRAVADKQPTGWALLAANSAGLLVLAGTFAVMRAAG